MELINNIKFRKSINKLIELIIFNNNDRNIVLNEIESLLKKTSEESFFYEMQEFLIEKNISLFLDIDSTYGFWNYREKWVEEETFSILKSQFPNYDITLPDSKQVGKFIDFKLIKDFDLVLRKHQLQYSYIKDKTFDYLTIIHQIKDKKEIYKLIKEIQYEIFEYK